MSVAEDMMATAIECVRKPGRTSIWSARLGKWLCSDDPEFQQALADQSTMSTAARAPIGAAFKLVFLTAEGGTAFFLIICVGLTILLDKPHSDFTERLILSVFDLAKIGVGAIAGLLGVKP